MMEVGSVGFSLTVHFLSGCILVGKAWPGTCANPEVNEKGRESGDARAVTGSDILSATCPFKDPCSFVSAGSRWRPPDYPWFGFKPSSLPSNRSQCKK